MKCVSRLGPAAGKAKIIIVAEEGDPTLLELERLPKESSVVLLRGTTAEEFFTPEGRRALAEANVLLNCVGEGKQIIVKKRTSGWLISFNGWH